MPYKPVLSKYFKRHSASNSVNQMSTTMEQPEASREGTSEACLLLQVLNIPHIFKQVVQELDPLDSLSLTSTCQHLYYRKGDIWNINRHLLHFLDNPRAFRSLMAKHHVLISGSDALQFFLQRRFEGSDLDVYLKGGEALYDFAKYLTEKEGYEFKPLTWQGPEVYEAIRLRQEHFKMLVRPPSRWHMHHRQEYFQKMQEERERFFFYEMRIEGVFHFTRKTNPERIIQLISTPSPPIKSSLTSFYSTTVLNFYTWNAAYSLFPHHTFTKWETYLTARPTEHRKRCWQKYEDRGWKVVNDAGHFDEHHSCTPSGKGCGIRRLRRIGDKYTWKLDFSTDGVDVDPQRQPDLLDWCTFNICYGMYRWHDYGRWIHGSPYHRRLEIECEAFSTTVFDGVLVTAGKYNSWKEFLEKKTGKKGPFQRFLVQVGAGKVQEVGVDAGDGGKGGDEMIGAVTYMNGEVEGWWESYQKRRSKKDIELEKDNSIWPRVGDADRLPLYEYHGQYDNLLSESNE